MKPLFITGAPCSGTTIMQKMLDKRKDISVTNEHNYLGIANALLNTIHSVDASPSLSPPSNPISKGLEGGLKEGEGYSRLFGGNGCDEGGCWSEDWTKVATSVCGVDDGLPRELHGITIPKWRRESLKAYGNAIVPQVAYQIFRSLP